MTVAIVVAYSANRVIGRDGSLPWRLPADMKHFRELTTGGTVVMGRRTFESLPDAYRPLPGRRNLVISGDERFHPEGAEVFRGPLAAISAAGGDCFVIGGAGVYAEALPLATRVHATEIEAFVEGDVFFPELLAGEWSSVSESEPLTENGLQFVHRVYERSR